MPSPILYVVVLVVYVVVLVVYVVVGLLAWSLCVAVTWGRRR